MAAAGVASAIAKALGEKNALKAFRRSLLPSGASRGGSSPEVAELRKRIGAIVEAGRRRGTAA